MSLLSRFVRAFRAEHVRRDIDDEADFHIEERTRRLMEAGSSRDQAAREARRRFGNRLRAREASLDVKMLSWLHSLLRDVRLGIRVHRRHAPGTVAAVLSLGLALGACVTAFSLVEALILRPLPVHAPERLVYAAFTNVDRSGRPSATESTTFNDPLFVRLREAGQGRVSLFAMSTQVLRSVTFGGAESEHESVRVQFASGNAFDVLGLAPQTGRLIVPGDDRGPGQHPVAVLSHAFWQRRFGGDPAVVGRWLSLQEAPLRMRPFQIVGISPAGFDGVEPGRPTDVWLPYAMYNARAFGNAQFNWFRVFGRLADGVTPAQAESTLQPAFAGFRREFNGFRPEDAPDARVRYQQVPLRLHPAANGPSPLRAQFEQPLLILSGIALLVLVIAGSNVANLFLARTRARQPELAVRLAIGAGRARLVQQVLIEAALIGVGTCIVGLGASAIAAPALVRLLTTPDDPIALTLVVNWKVGVVAAALTAGVTLIFGLAPAISASRAAPMTMLRSGGTRTASRPAAMRPFVLVQVAFSLTILFIGGLLVSSFSRLMHFDPGFTRSDVLVVGVEPLRSVDPAARRDALLRVLAHLRTLPGVEAVAAADFNLVGRAWTLDFVRPAAPASPPIETTMAPVTPGFFDTMGVRLLQGRDVTERETLDADSAAIVVSESFARAYFGSPKAVGRTVDRLFGEEGGAPRHQIVGVAADTHHSLRDEPAPTVYFPMPLRATGTIHVRSSGDPRALVPQVREAVRAGDPLFRVSSTTTQAAILDRTLVRERLVALLSGFFAVVGLVLAAVGLYGVLNDSVVLRTREIGVRLALGGSRLDVLRAIVWDVVRTTVAGAAVGLASGLYLSRFVESLLFDTSPLDLRSLVVPLAALVVAGTAAAVTPALRAFRVDPVRALRED